MQDMSTAPVGRERRPSWLRIEPARADRAGYVVARPAGPVQQALEAFRRLLAKPVLRRTRGAPSGRPSRHCTRVAAVLFVALGGTQARSPATRRHLEVAGVRAISPVRPCLHRRRSNTFVIRGPGEESNLACGRGEPSLGPPHPVRVVAVCLPAHDVRLRTGVWPAANRCTHSCGRDAGAAVPNSPTARQRSRLPKLAPVTRPEWTMPSSEGTHEE